ncbi:MAG TPA: imidazoleglycerol-phosphate dehydratase HisB [Chloroflexota bacterium]|nr:imidazoleglycerol-phosphate dehydratase HisB [Chloroflexota bacterium]HZU06278.1 imidazoleglycerol-phosphate dehydratase HisB [Chloroflexota bacterium]
MGERIGRCVRQTRETHVEVEWVLDGSGRAEVQTGVGYLDHMLDALARHGLFDLRVRATGDLHVDEHHTVEDVAIALGRALADAVGDGRGLRRMGDALVPLDEALALVAVDLSGRGLATLDIPLRTPRLGQLPTELVPHFFQSLAMEARITLHVHILRGENDHHKVEAAFKALARALDWATSIDPRVADQVPSTKGVLQ